MEENKNVVTGNEVANNEEQNKVPEAGAQQDQEKKDNKVIAFFKKNGKKIAGIGAIVGAVGAGMAIDHFGLKLPIGKKKDDDPVETED